MNERAWKILFPPHSLSVESRALVSLWSDVWLGLRLFRFPHSSSYKTGYIHPSFTEQMIIRLLLKELLFLFGRQWRGLHFHFYEKPVLVLLISGPFFFFSHLFCSPCWQIWMSEASVLSVLSEPCAACSHWRKIKLKIHIFISRFELA